MFTTSPITDVFGTVVPYQILENSNENSLSPLNHIEEIMIEVWHKELKVEIERDSNFFALGNYIFI